MGRRKQISTNHRASSQDDFENLVKQCSILTFDKAKSEFNKHQFQVETERCSKSSCALKIAALQDQEIIDGASIVCDQKPYFGIVIEALNDHEETEFMVISGTNFEKLEQFQKDEKEAIEQVYEEVAGFESLRKIFTMNDGLFQIGHFP